MPEVSEKMVDKVLDMGYLLSDGEIIPAAELDAYKATSGDSPVERQSRDKELVEFDYTTDDLAEPPYDLGNLIRLLGQSTDFFRCCKVLTDDACGLNYRVVEVTGDGVPKADKKNATPVKEFFEGAGGITSFIQVMNRTVFDLNSTGNGYLEVARKPDGIPEKVFHVPSPSMRVRKKNAGYVQKIGQTKIFFQRWGDKFKREGDEVQPKCFLDKNDGKPQPEDALNFMESANEMLHFMVYNPGSTYYGIPYIIPATSAVVGNISAAVYNITFFSNNAVPQYAIIIKGAKLGPELESAIKLFFQAELKGKPHRTLILPVPFADVEVELVPLAVEIKDESFTIYRKGNRDEILRAHGVPPARIGVIEVASLGSGTGQSQAEHYKNSVVEPAQHYLEHMLNYTLVKDGLGITDWEFKFQDLDIRDKTQEIDNGIKELTRGAISLDEFRTEVLAKEKTPGGDKPFIIVGNSIVYIEDLRTFEGDDSASKVFEGMQESLDLQEDTLKSLEEEIKRLGILDESVG